jgi:hypothetical protein
MKFRIGLSMSMLALMVSSAVLAVEYKAGWDAEAFYAEVATCRQAITYPAIKAYLDRGIAAKRAEEELRNELISILPALEHPSVSACYCVVNEAAKTRDFKTYYGSGDFTARMTILAALLESPACSGKLEAGAAELEKKEARDAFTLK